MIVLYSGTPGSGKSLDTARTIHNWCRRGAPIICNFPLNEDNIRVRRRKDIHFIPNGELDPDGLVAFSRTYFAGRPCKGGQHTSGQLTRPSYCSNARDWSVRGP